MSVRGISNHNEFTNETAEKYDDLLHSIAFINGREFQEFKSRSHLQHSICYL